jgi:hypothetical protein
MRVYPTFLINQLPIKSFYLLVFFSVVFFSYRQQYLGDASYFINAGKGIISGNNEFKVNALHSGPLGVLFMATAFGYLGALSIFIVTFFNLSGIYFFIRLILSGISEKYVLIIVFFTLISSPTREMLVNGQITGIIMGLVAAGSFLLRKYRFQYLGLIPIILAVELKPHFALPLVFLALVFSDQIKWANIGRMFLLTFTGHAIVNIHLKSITEIDLANNIIFLTDTKVTIFERSVWTLLDAQFNSYVTLIAKVLIIIGLVGFAIYLFKRGSLLQSAVALLLVPSTQSYIHLYDFIWMIPVTILLLHNRLVSQKTYSMALVCILMLPHPYWNVLNFLLFGFFCFVVLSFSSNELKVFEKKQFLAAIFLAAIIPITYSTNLLSYQENEAIFHTFVVALFATQLIMKRKESPGSEIIQP